MPDALTSGTAHHLTFRSAECDFSLGYILARIELKLDALAISQEEIMATLDDVLVKASELPGIADSLETLIAQLRAIIAGGGDAQAKVDEINAILVAQNARLAALAVTP